MMEFFFSFSLCFESSPKVVMKNIYSVLCMNGKLHFCEYAIEFRPESVHFFFLVGSSVCVCASDADYREAYETTHTIAIASRVHWYWCRRCKWPCMGAR